LLLDGIEREPATVNTAGGVPTESFVVLDEPWFDRQVVGKDITLTGSALGNNGTVPVTDYISPYAVQVDATSIGASGFTTEAGLTWKFAPDFVAEVATVHYELIDAGSVAAKTLTLRQALPSSPVDLLVFYTAVLSAQLLKNESVVNEGSGGTAGNIYYPFYLFDIAEGIRQVIDEVTAAGVIPEFQRTF
jgi:hypothetical protein